jgi:hypothetical protein
VSIITIEMLECGKSALASALGRFTMIGIDRQVRGLAIKLKMTPMQKVEETKIKTNSKCELFLL